MFRKVTGKNYYSQILRDGVSFMLILSILIVGLFADLSFSKYVLNPIQYDLSLTSVVSYPLGDIGDIIGATQVGSVLNAGEVFPSDATVTYQWQRADSADGPYTDVSGATSNTYALGAGDLNGFFRVVATGTGKFSGTATSNGVGPVVGRVLISIGEIYGIPRIGKDLTAGALNPAGATATYQWQVGSTYDGPFADIAGATRETYTVTEKEYGKYIRVVATGTHAYSGTVMSAPTGPVSQSDITGMSPIIGSALQGQTLTAGTVFPLGATVAYQWQKSSDGINYTNITGATAKSYQIKGNDSQFFIRIVATGTGLYSGTAMAVTASKVTGSAGTITAIGNISGITQVGRELSAGVLTPTGATATYQWQSSPTGAEGTFSDIPGAVFKTYTTTISDLDKYIRLIAKGSATYLGTVTSDVVGPISYGQISGIGAIKGPTAVGETLTVGDISPLGATVSYQWMKASHPNGPYEEIAGATGTRHMLTPADMGAFFKVVARGIGSYEGVVESIAAGPISGSSTQLISIDNIGGIARVGSTLTAGQVNPSLATVSYQWQISNTLNGEYADIYGATSNTYNLKADDHGKFVRLVATGSGKFSGSVISKPIGPVADCLLVEMSPIVGAAVPGQVLYAGTIIPEGATVDYQWQMSTNWEGTQFTNIGSNTNRLEVSGSYNGQYIRLIVTGKGVYSGTLTSMTLSRVGASAGDVTAIGEISGTPKVGSVLRAGTLTPSNAVVTYQWQISDTGKADSFNDVFGATSSQYIPTSKDSGKYIRVMVKGAGNYLGTLASNPTAPVQTMSINGISNIIGTTAVGESLYAGELQPSDAAATFQWQRAAGIGGPFEDVPGAIDKIYTLTEEDSGHYLRVVARGVDGYAGTVTSSYIGPVYGMSTPITSMGPLAGAHRVGSTLTAGDLDPLNATVTYQWQVSVAEDGVYTNIQGATSRSYTLTPAEHKKYVRVMVTGAERYVGCLTSEPTTAIAECPITSMTPIVGSVVTGQVLTAGTIFPSGATVDYKWEMCDKAGGNTSPLGTNSNTVLLNNSENGRYIKLTITGKGAYTGTLTAVTSTYVQRSKGTLNSVGDISGTAQVGRTLNPGKTNPADIPVTYQWQRSDTGANNSYTDIFGATLGSYALTAQDFNKYIRVVVTASGNYTGTATSNATEPIAASRLVSISEIQGSAKVGEYLTAGTLMPSDAIATYQWVRARVADGAYEIIPGATATRYTLTQSDTDYHIAVKATAIGSYTGTVMSPYTSLVGNTATKITEMAPISGTAQVGSILTAGEVSPAGSTGTYKWQICDTVDGIYVDIPGATFNNYTPTADDYGKYIRVVAMGSGSFYGALTSESVGQVMPCPLVSISPIVGSTVVGQILRAGTIMPAGATVDYQWQKSGWDGNNFTNIETASNSSTFTVDSSENGGYIRVVVTGKGAYSGTVMATTPKQVDSAGGQITGIGDINGTATIGSTLTAGTITPSAAMVTYQWQSSATLSENGFSDIYGATNNTYAVSSADYGRYIRLVATGSGTHTGDAVSKVIGPISAIPITDLSGVIGAPTVGEALTAGEITPAGAKVAWQWQKAETEESEYADIPNATFKSYIPTLSDLGCYIRLIVTGIDTYTGVLIADAGVVSSQEIFSFEALDRVDAGTEGSAVYEDSQSIAAILPNNVAANDGAVQVPVVSWEDTDGYDSSLSGSYTFTAVVGEMPLGYINPADLTATVEVVVSKILIPIESMEEVEDPVVAGEVLTAGAITPAGATVSWQWQKSETEEGEYVDIPEATDREYTPTDEDVNYFLRVVVTGEGDYSGTMIAVIGPVLNSEIELSDDAPEVEADYEEITITQDDIMAPDPGLDLQQDLDTDVLSTSDGDVPEAQSHASGLEMPPRIVGTEMILQI